RDDLLAVLLLDGAGHGALLGLLADGLVVLLAAVRVEPVDLFLVGVLRLALDDGGAGLLAIDLQVALGAGDRPGDRDFLGRLLLGARGQRQGADQRQADQHRQSGPHCAASLVGLTRPPANATGSRVMREYMRAPRGKQRGTRPSYRRAGPHR